MKCLEKDRGRRFETASGLARDLQRYLADEVVEARPRRPATGYGSSPGAPGTTGRGGRGRAALLGGVAASTWQAVRAMVAEAKAVAERDGRKTHAGGSDGP